MERHWVGCYFRLSDEQRPSKDHTELQQHCPKKEWAMANSRERDFQADKIASAMVWRRQETQYIWEKGRPTELWRKEWRRVIGDEFREARKHPTMQWPVGCTKHFICQSLEEFPGCDKTLFVFLTEFGQEKSHQGDQRLEYRIAEERHWWQELMGAVEWKPG